MGRCPERSGLQGTQRGFPWRVRRDQGALWLQCGPVCPAAPVPVSAQPLSDPRAPRSACRWPALGRPPSGLAAGSACSGATGTPRDPGLGRRGALLLGGGGVASASDDSWFGLFCHLIPGLGDPWRPCAPPPPQHQMSCPSRPGSSAPQPLSSVPSPDVASWGCWSSERPPRQDRGGRTGEARSQARWAKSGLRQGGQRLVGFLVKLGGAGCS